MFYGRTCGEKVFVVVRGFNSNSDGTKLKSCIFSFTLSGHGLSGVVCRIHTLLPALKGSLVKNDILLPITNVDLDTFGWRRDPKTYQDNIDLP